MTLRRFHSSRSNRALVFTAATLLLLVGVGFIAMGIEGYQLLFMVLGALLLLGLLALFTSRRKALIEYELGADALVLRRGTAEEQLLLDEVMDVNLVDKFTARNFVSQDQATGDTNEMDHPGTVTTRFCGTPIGQGPLAAVLHGTSALSKRSFRSRLVLVRVRGGDVFLLSPRHGASMVSAIAKQLKEKRATGNPSSGAGN